MNLSRRDFLKALGITAGAAAIGLPVLPAPEPTSIAVQDVQAIDAPVTKETPFAWLEINGERYAASETGLTVNNWLDDNYILRWDAEITADLYGRIDSHQLANNKFPLILSVPGEESVLVKATGRMRKCSYLMSSNEVTSSVVIDLSSMEININTTVGETL